MSVFNLQKSRAARLIDNLTHDPNLVALWAMNEQSGTIIDHCTLNRLNSIAISGTPDYSQSIGDLFAIQFVAASSEAISLGDVLDYERTQPFSVLAAVRAAAAQSAYGQIISKMGPTWGTDPGWEFLSSFHAGNQYLILRLINTYPTSFINLHTPALSLDDAIDYLVGFSYDGSSTAAGIAIYVNGVSQAITIEADTLGATILNNAPLSIGSQNYSTVYWDGKIGPVAVFNAAKTAADFKRWAAIGGFL